ncbi:MATE family efflux transporter [Clostridium sp. UBA4548]|uniref:MATE family efflux transporter n=1 Tax=Clostridium sp. UBA4548 TaxID=1946361 RepID=UPI0025BD188D|nr:MATE family efflux transporter [Clostridium sp. UBA4548]
MDRTMELGQGSVGKLLLKFSIPAIIGMIVNALYNIVDRIFIGQIPGGVGELALSGVTVTFPISTVIMAFGMLVGIGSAALISIRLGQQKKDEAEKILGNALILVIIILVALAIITFPFLDKLLVAFGASENILPYAKEYIQIIIAGGVIQNIGFGLNAAIRSEGNPKIAMLTMLLGAITNTVLDPIFIFVFDMGVAGAAIATVIAQLASTVWVLYHFTKGKSTLKLRKENFKLDKEIIKNIFAIGMSPFFMQLAASLVGVISNKALLTHGGDFAIGAMGVISSVAMMCLMPVFGINQGSQPIIGYNYGAKNYKRVKKAWMLAVIAAVAITTTGFLVVELAAPSIIRIFNSNADLVAIGTHGIRIYLSMLPVIGFQVISTNYFQAVGKAKISMFLSLVRQVIVLIPLLLILPPIFGLNGVWISGPTSDAVASIITVFFVMRELKELKQQELETRVA